tara:strand:- start:28 stop:285 length:258 start_codon:yes stop_codon:yes gene_type:complete
MIDTDKYEGHYTDDFARFWVTADDELNADIERANATTNLIDDAPRLLAEVKRLRSIADDLYAYIVSDADISLSTIEEQMDWREEE